MYTVSSFILTHTHEAQMISNKKAGAQERQILTPMWKMADTALEDHDSFSCPICLDPLQDPVTIPCGHNYCMACINDYWNQHEYTGAYRCPECRESFTPRPTLNKNGMFAEVVERLQKTRLRDSSPADSGPAHVECRECVGRNPQAIGTCPERGLDADRYDSANLREKHIVIVVSGDPSKNICVHNMPLEIYCRTDQQLICSFCYVESHRNHDAVSVAPFSSERPLCERCHGKKCHRQRSHGHSRKSHKCSGHRSGHGSGKKSPLRSTREAGHCESHGHGRRRQERGSEGGGHVVGRPDNWQMNSRHGSRTPGPSRANRSRHLQHVAVARTHIRHGHGLQSRETQ
ncbi:E3 ubiquitin-protein ligase TRIM47 [Brachyhypopomus gauderio]|uniref:E3 ubiquitin-protein ligase TRIM47 n=1 Tax=Brachyhypopomus gauderio TaxID=698409 RepID=UPI0040430177